MGPLGGAALGAGGGSNDGFWIEADDGVGSKAGFGIEGEDGVGSKAGLGIDADDGVGPAQQVEHRGEHRRHDHCRTDRHLDHRRVGRGAGPRGGAGGGPGGGTFSRNTLSSGGKTTATSQDTRRAMVTTANSVKQYSPAELAAKLDGVTGPIQFDEKGDIRNCAITVRQFDQSNWTDRSVVR